MKLILLPLMTFSVAACQSETKEPIKSESCAELPNLDPAKATQDALDAVKNGDRRLLGVYGFTTVIPAGEGSDLPVRMIEGTTDAPDSEDCGRRNRRAIEYAAAYNRRMIAETSTP